MEFIQQPGGGVWITKAPNWSPDIAGDILKIGVSKDGIRARAERGQRFKIGQMYGVLGPGMISAQHVFQGLRRDMLVRDDEDAAAKKLAVTWKANRDAVYVGDKNVGGHLEFMDAPQNRVFAVYVSRNEMLEQFPDIYGWAEHWTWIAAAPDLAGAPVGWDERYDKQLWSRVA